MARFDDIAGGSTSVLRKKLQMFGKEVEVGIRPLSDWDEAEATARARATAKKQGVEDPKEGDELFDRARFAETIHLAFVDADSPDDAPVPFFDVPVETVRRRLDPEMIAFLYEEWRLWQDLCSPRPLNYTAEEYVRVVTEAAEMGDPKALERFFWSSRLSVRPSLLATLAAQYVSSAQLNLHYSSASASNTSSSSRATEATP